MHFYAHLIRFCVKTTTVDIHRFERNYKPNTADVPVGGYGAQFLHAKKVAKIMENCIFRTYQNICSILL